VPCPFWDMMASVSMMGSFCAFRAVEWKVLAPVEMKAEGVLRALTEEAMARRREAALLSLVIFRIVIDMLVCGME